MTGDVDAARAARAAVGVAEGYLELQGMLAPEKRGHAPGAPSVTPGLPIAVDVVDTIAEVESMVARHLPLVRGALRLGPAAPVPGTTRVTATVSAILLIGQSLREVAADSPVYAGEVAADVWKLFGRVSRTLGRPRVRPHRVDDPCPACGLPSVWVDPAGLRIACGLPSCGYTRSLVMAGESSDT